MIHVAVAVIQDDQGRILLSQRKAGTHQGGLWEFPGGKLEPGETLSEALKREILEELGIGVLTHQPLIRVTHRYSDHTVLLDVHRVTRFEGDPRGMEGQPLAWVTLEQIGEYPLPAADRPIVTALSLPASYLITGDGAEQPSPFLARLSVALEQGQRLIQLRAPGLTEQAFRQLSASALTLCNAFNARLLLNSTPGMVVDTGAAGVHLNSRRLMAQQERPLSKVQLVAASCHSLEELQHAELIGVDFAVLSPVLKTASHPEATAMGWAVFSRLVDEVSIPVYALGGMKREMIGQAQAAGGQGIAAISGLWPTN